jgi:SNF2 family DNA or RNA helicase
LNSIKVKLINSSIEFSGDIDLLLDSPIISDWLINNYERYEEKNESCIVSDSSFETDRGLFEFKNSLEFRLKNIVNINYDESFLSAITNELSKQQDFKDFSEKASKIWDGKYDPNHFNNFCNVLTNHLTERRLYKYQLLSAYHLAFSQNSCNFSVPGSGKTSIVYGAFSFLNSLGIDSSKYVDKILVIGPYSSFDPWEEEYELCFGKKPRIYRVSDEKSQKKKKDVLKGITSEKYDIILTTYNSVLTLYQEIEIFLKANKVMFVCDEAHKIKNIEGAWADNVLELAPYAKSRVVLTGTPCPNGYEDLYNLFKFIYPDKNIIEYNYSHLKSISNQLITRDIESLKNNINPFSIRIKKSHLNLPSFIDHIPTSNILNNLEKDIYESLLKEMNLSRTSFSSNEKNKGRTFALHQRIMQASSNIALLKKPLDEIEDIDPSISGQLDLKKVLGDEIIKQLNHLDDSYIPSKHKKLLEIISPLISQGKKVIVWARYVDSIKRLTRYLTKMNLKGSYIVGETDTAGGSESDRSAIIKDFKNNNDTNFLVTSPMVLGESVSLHKVCHDAVYIEMDYNAATYFQSRDRIHRVWLDKHDKQIDYETNYYHIISTTDSGIETIDSKIFSRVNAKLERMLQIIEDDIPLFNENPNQEIEDVINEMIDEYRNR